MKASKTREYVERIPSQHTRLIFELFPLISELSLALVTLMRRTPYIVGVTVGIFVYVFG